MTTLIYTPTPQGATKTPPVPRRHPSASFSRQAVFHAFGVRHGKARGTDRLDNIPPQTLDSSFFRLDKP